MKLCPYNCARQIQRYHQQNRFDEATGNMTGYDYQLQTTYVPLPCVGENCGAWKNGACGFSKSSNDS